MISPHEDRTFPALENLLSWTSKRQQALASNVANRDTPGYRATDYSFESELQASVRLTLTSPQHIAASRDIGNARVYEVETSTKPNGNSVDIDRELTEVTKNGVQYLTLVEYLNQKIRTLRAAINEGARS